MEQVVDNRIIRQVGVVVLDIKEKMLYNPRKMTERGLHMVEVVMEAQVKIFLIFLLQNMETMDGLQVAVVDKHIQEQVELVGVIVIQVQAIT